MEEVSTSTHPRAVDTATTKLMSHHTSPWHVAVYLSVYLDQVSFRGKSQAIHSVCPVVRPLAKLGRCLGEIHVCCDGAVHQCLWQEREEMGIRGWGGVGWGGVE